MNNNFSENDLIDGLREGRDEIIKYAYDTFKSRAYKIVLSNNGSEHEAESIFHDALIVLIENIRDQKFKGDSLVSTYLTGIIKFKWLNELKKNGRHLNTKEDFPEINLVVNNAIDEELSIIEEKQWQQLELSIEKLKDDCRKLLQLYYYKNEKLKNIAQMMDYTESFVRVKKLRCMSALKSLVEKNIL